jgi:hypothetical protein
MGTLASPPATSTLPEGSSVAVWYARAVTRDPVVAKFDVPSNNSALDWTPP